MKKIPLTGKRGGFALVSDRDYRHLRQYRWNHLCTGYAARYDSGKMIYMHRHIKCPLPHEEVDHIDGNRLNNQRSNLRIADRRTNATNSGKRYPRGHWGRNVTKMRGRTKPFHVQCWYHGEPISGGYYATVEEAQRAAAALREELQYVK